MTRHGQTRHVQESWESWSSAAASLWSLMPKTSWLQWRCIAALILKHAPVRPPASFNPSLWLRLPPFLHPSICYTLPICFHLSACDCSPGGTNGSGQWAEAGTYSQSGIRKVLSPTSFHFLCLWNGDSESASHILVTQTLNSYKLSSSCRVPLLQTL